jgi:hypothetical protein
VRDFLAKTLFVGDVDGVPMVALAEQPDRSGQSVIIQGEPEGVPAGSAADVVRYCVSTEAGATVYDAFTGWAWRRPTLILDFRKDAAAALGVPDRLIVTVAAADLSNVAERIERLTGIPPGDIPGR